MRALTVEPGTPHSLRLEEVAPPPRSDGAVLARALALGICGTDREIIAGEYGWAPEGSERLIIGHESLGRVEQAPGGSGLAPGDLVVGIVRRPDPVPCPACAADEWDMCRNGQYTERGIKQRNGYGSEYFRIGPRFRDSARPFARAARRAVGADERRCQGLGAGRAHRRARSQLAGARRPDHRRRPRRPVGCAARQLARLRIACVGS